MSVATMTRTRLDHWLTAVSQVDVSTYLTPIARAMFSAIFIQSAPSLFRLESVTHAAQRGVPLPALLVPLAGVLALFGGLSVLLGYRARLGAWALVLFLVPVTLKMHSFWTISDPGAAQLQQIMFMKNLSMLGGALLIARFGAGPVSMDGDTRHRSAK